MNAAPPAIAAGEHIEFLHWSVAQQVRDRVRGGASPDEATQLALDGVFGCLAKSHPEMLALYADNLQAHYAGGRPGSSEKIPQ